MSLTKSEKRIVHNILIFLVQASATFWCLIAGKLVTHECAVGEELRIYAAFQSDVHYMAMIVFTFLAGYAVFCNVYIRGLSVFALFGILAFWRRLEDIFFLSTLCYIALYNVSTIVLVCRVKKNKKCNVPDVWRRLLSVNCWLLYPLLAVVIGFNIWYIMSPKNELYAYHIKSEKKVICQIDGETVRVWGEVAPRRKMQEEEDRVVYVEFPFDIATDNAASDRATDIYRGYRIIAQNEGTATVAFREVFLSDNNRRWGRLMKEIKVRVDEELKMHFDIDFEYAANIYRANLYAIAVCILWMLMSLLYRISMCVRRKK